MEQLGYYAKDKNNNLFQFEWSSKDELYLYIDGKLIKANPNLYEILEMGYFTIDDF